jgi:hypothetical protein
MSGNLKMLEFEEQNNENACNPHCMLGYVAG